MITSDTREIGESLVTDWQLSKVKRTKNKETSDQYSYNEIMRSRVILHALMNFTETEMEYFKAILPSIPKTKKLYPESVLPNEEFLLGFVISYF